MAKYKLLKAYEKFKAGDMMEISGDQLPYFKGMGFIDVSKPSAKKETKVSVDADVKASKMDSPQTAKINPSK